MLSYLKYDSMLWNMTTFWTTGYPFIRTLLEVLITGTESTSGLDLIWAKIHIKNPNYGIAYEKEDTGKWLNFTFGSSSRQDQLINQ